MRTFFTFLAGAGLALSLTTAYAAEGAAPATPAKAPTAQQSKMATCNTEAGDKKGDEQQDKHFYNVHNLYSLISGKWYEWS